LDGSVALAVEILGYSLFAMFGFAMAYAAVSDLLTLTIPNRLILALVGLFMALWWATGMSWVDFALHWAAGGLVLVVAFFCFAMGWVGGGDAKLAAAIALWLGWGDAVMFVGLASVYGGVLTLLLLAFRHTVVPVFAIRQPWVQRLHDEKTGVPYGIALAAAGLTLYPDSVWMKLAIG
jgi:prepilin peptidase CpaA